MNETPIKYDVIVIGAGVVGCAMARHFTLQGIKVLAIEKGADILDGASKGNTAILHCGFDAPPGSVEHECIADGYDEYLRIHKKLNLPMVETGALALAWNRQEEERLDQVLDKAHANGIHEARLLTAKQILTREPHLAADVKAAVEVPKEYLIDPWSAPFAYMLQAVENGARLMRDCEVLNGEFNGDDWQLTTSHGTVRGIFVINCAGLYGDRVDASLIGQTSFQVRPRKGQFLVYDKSARRLLNSIILPLPNETTKGVVVCPTVFGNVLVGPSSENQKSRTDASVSADVLLALRHKGEAILPALAHQPITATYAGIRPATEFRDYCIRAHADKNYISVGGIRSTGLSAALGIARYVFKQYADFGGRHAIPAECPRPVWTAINPIAEHQTRDWQNPGNGGMVCHCELVTRREIQQALSGKIPVASLGGLKRRTRATMGRCQGFYCYPRIAELTHGCFAEPMTFDNDDTNKTSIKNHE